jgi:hypothetical protein
MYAQQTGDCETSNWGVHPELPALAWTWLGDSAVERSYLRFDLDGMPAGSFSQSTLNLHTSRPPSVYDNDFAMVQVAQPWSESTINWVNRPAVTGTPVVVTSGTGPYSVVVTPIVQSWTAAPSTNHGFEIRQAIEQFYRSEYFHSSDAVDPAVRPRLTIDFSNPDGEPLSDYVIASVSSGEETTFSYLVDGVPVSPTSQTSTTMTIGGIEYAGERIGFETGISCPSSVGYHDRLEVFAYVDTLSTLALEFDRDPDTYLPMKGDSIRVTARITPEPPQGSEVVFRLASVDSLRFKDTALDSLVVPVVADTASAKLWSYAYWGVADVTATYHGPDGDMSDTAEIPVDEDDDGIADSWELSPEGGGAMNLGGSYQDQDWDGEVTSGTPFDGDGFTRLTEYKGLAIGPKDEVLDGNFTRMRADEKEFLLGVPEGLEAPADSAMIRIDLQLDIAAFDYRSGVDTVWVFGRPFSNKGLAILKIVVPDTTEDGIVWVNGSFTGHNSRYGLTNNQMYYAGSSVGICVDTIYNTWHENSAHENEVNLPIPRIVPEESENDQWIAYFDGEDLNGDTQLTLLNPWDLLGQEKGNGNHHRVSNNDTYDGIIARRSEEQHLFLTVLHELGHALGMGAGETHPSMYPSPMRIGPGPGMTWTYHADDISEVRLK